MGIFRISALVAGLSLAAPSVALGASADFAASLSATFGIDAPGATVEIIPESDALVDLFELGTGIAGIVPFQDEASLTASADLSGSASAPFGVAEAILLAFVGIDVFNDTTTAIDATLDWDIAVSTDADVIESLGFFVDAISLAFLEVYAYVATEPVGFDGLGAPVASVEAETDPFFGLVGPSADSDIGSLDFTIGAGETLFVEVNAFAAGFAEVVPVPLPASLGFALMGLAGLGALRFRRA